MSQFRDTGKECSVSPHNVVVVDDGQQGGDGHQVAEDVPQHGVALDADLVADQQRDERDHQHGVKHGRADHAADADVVLSTPEEQIYYNLLPAVQILKSVTEGVVPLTVTFDLFVVNYRACSNDN